MELENSLFAGMYVYTFQPKNVQAGAVMELRSR